MIYGIEINQMLQSITESARYVKKARAIYQNTVQNRPVEYQPALEHFVLQTMDQVRFNQKHGTSMECHDCHVFVRCRLYGVGLPARAAVEGAAKPDTAKAASTEAFPIYGLH